MTDPAFGKPVVILISADLEWKVVVEHLHPTCLEDTPYGKYFYLTMNSRKVIFFHGGWGKINAAGSTQFAISRWDPKLIINAGTCGGFQGLVKYGEVVLAEKTIVYDLIEQMGDQEEAIRTYQTELDLSFLKKPYPQVVRKTLLISGDRDLVSSEIPELKRKYGAIAGDWESGAIAYTANANGVPCLILRGVSDVVGVDGGEVYDNISLYSERAKGVMVNLLTHLEGWIKQSV